MSSLKIWACSMEKNIAQISGNSGMSNYSQDNQQKHMLENLREVFIIK